MLTLTFWNRNRVKYVFLQTSVFKTYSQSGAKRETCVKRGLWWHQRVAQNKAVSLSSIFTPIGSTPIFNFLGQAFQWISKISLFLFLDQPLRPATMGFWSIQILHWKNKSTTQHVTADFYTNRLVDPEVGIFYLILI